MVRLAVPAKTPAEVIRRLHQEAVKALNLPNVKQRLIEDASIVVGAGPEEFGKFIKSERSRWGEIVRKAKLQAD
jgi:tripartite-type tricarboxylate transporter receptor subunit TctC